MDNSNVLFNNISNIFSGIVDDCKIENYAEKREKYISKGKGNDFKEAVKHMDEYMSNRTVSYMVLFFLNQNWFHFMIKMDIFVNFDRNIAQTHAFQQATFVSRQNVILNPL